MIAINTGPKSTPMLVISDHRSLQSLPRNEDEENTENCIDQDRETEDHQGTLVEQLSNIRFLDAREAHEGVFTEAGESEDRVEGVLVGETGVDTDREWKNDLGCELDNERPHLVGETYPATSGARVVEEYEHKRSPETCKNTEQANNRSHDERWWDEVAESLHSKEARESITLHSLEYIILCSIENLGIISALLFDSDSDILGDRVREDDFAFGTRKEEGVEDLLSGSSDVRSGDGMGRRVGVGGQFERAAHEARARLFVGLGLSHVGANAAGRRVSDIPTIRRFLAEERRHLRILVLLLLGIEHGRSSGGMVHLAQSIQQRR